MLSVYEYINVLIVDGLTSALSAVTNDSALSVPTLASSKADSSLLHGDVDIMLRTWIHRYHDIMILNGKVKVLWIQREINLIGRSIDTFEARRCGSLWLSVDMSI